MVISPPRPFHALTATEPTAAAKARRRPKRQTMALPHSLKLPVLNTCPIKPSHRAATASGAANHVEPAA